jgi:hypothetical protein
MNVGTRTESPSPRLSAIQALLAAMRVPTPSGPSPAAKVQLDTLDGRKRGRNTRKGVIRSR